MDFRLSNIPFLISESYKSSFSILKEIPRKLYTLSIIVSCCIFFASLTSSFWIVRATEIIGMNETQWGGVMLISGLVSVILGIPAGHIVDRHSKKWIAGICLIIGSIQSYLFIQCTTYRQVLLLAAFSTITNAFLNPAFSSLFADMTSRSIRGRVLSSIGGGGIWLMRGAYGSGILGMSMQTTGTFLSGYLYEFNNNYPWFLLSGAFFIFGLLFIIWVKEPEIAEI
jgi:MFS family permease